jgi:hypothetical protein
MAMVVAEEVEVGEEGTTMTMTTTMMTTTECRSLHVTS